MKTSTVIVGVAAVAVIGVVAYVALRNKKITITTTPAATTTAPSSTPPTQTQPADPWERLAYKAGESFLDELFTWIDG